jgi:hypothetical protein
MNHLIVLLLHLLAAFIFVGMVFFEVLMLEGIRAHVPHDAMRSIEIAIGQRARKFMPYVIIVLYGAGITMAWGYRAVLAHPFASMLGGLLTLKILLALSVLVHFIIAIRGSAKGTLKARAFKNIHRSVFIHMVFIIILAKAMFYLN